MNSRNRFVMLLFLNVFFLIMFFSLSMILENNTSPLSVISEMINGTAPAYRYEVIQDLKIQRGLTAILAGGMLGLAGAMIQSLSRNPLAEPGLIGVTAGGVCAAVLWITFGPAHLQLSFFLPFFACFGGILAAFSVYVLSSYTKKMSSVFLLNGILISAVLQAVTSFILLRHQEALGSILLWTIGSLNGRVWTHLNLLWPIAVPALIAGLLTAGIANAWRLGTESAVLLGLSLKKTNALLFFISALLTAGAVSIVGAIGFIGLIGPHIAKRIVGEDARKSFPISMLLSSLLLLTADLIAQYIFSFLPFSFISQNIQLPAGAVTVIMGVPFFLYLLRKQT
ncbi:iron ABC transporter permease [Bacillus paralicheniformis]|uniref:FecCD family ABC transporter permease n=1 Tax=Bacillus paralicheniformis TaxID=1648923 RepID=UPI003D209A2F